MIARKRQDDMEPAAWRTDLRHQAVQLGERNLITRREALVGVAGATVFRASAARASDNTVLPTGATGPRVPLTITEQLMYSTVRLVNRTETQLHWGTGFIFAFFSFDGASVPAIVTNRHVLESWSDCSFLLTGKTDDGLPDLDNHIPVELPNLHFIPHPRADLAIVPVGGVFAQLLSEGRRPFYAQMDQSIIPTKSELAELTPVEQIITVGFPGQLWDDVHNLPLFHRGYTATPPYIDFQGKKEFLIDIATWPGSSGSPVLLYNAGSYQARNGSLMIGNRIKLIGVAYGVAVQDVTGNVAIQNAPTQLKVTGQMAVPTNLGACISATRILEFEPVLVKMGFKVPDGYTMRPEATSDQ